MAPRRPRPADTEASNTLFHVDSVGSASIRDSLTHGPFASKHRRQSGTAATTLRSHQILEQIKHHGAPALVSSSRSAKPRPLLSKLHKSRLNSQVIRRGSINKVTSLAEISDGQQLEGRSGYSTARASLPLPATEYIWSFQPIVSVAAIKAPKTVRQLQGVEGVQLLPHPVPVPHPGQSYNPTMDDHQALLREAVTQAEKEEAQERQARSIQDRLDAGRRDVDAAEPWTFLESQSVLRIGDGHDVEENKAGDEEEEVIDSVTDKTRRKPRKKTVQKRKRLALLKLGRHSEIERRQNRQLRHSLHSLSAVESEIRSDLAKSQLDTASRRVAKKEQLSQLGFLNRVASKKTLQLTDDLSETGLRGLKPEGSLWRDWDESVRRRGQVERAKYIPHKGSVIKGGVKGRRQREVEKPGWRMFDKA